MKRIINFIMLFISLYTFHTAVETYTINKQINDFKKSANFEFSSDNVNYYKVDGVITNQSGDILLSRKSGNPNLLLRDFISFYVGGHAGLVISEDETLEVFGNLENDNIVKVYDNDWVETETEVIGLKVNGNYDLEYNQYLNQPYNWFPFFDNPNKRYCTDLVSKVYNQVGININYDFGIVTVNDIILSKETSIYLYKETNGKEINIYYTG